MKTLLTILLILFCFVSFGQVVVYSGAVVDTQYVRTTGGDKQYSPILYNPTIYSPTITGQTLNDPNVSGTLTVGYTTNYTQVDSVYGVKLVGGAMTWDDQQGDVVSALTGATQWTQEGFCTTGYITPFLVHNQNDFFQVKIQFSHRKALGTQAEVHLHYTPMAATSGATDSVVLRYQWIWFNIGDTLTKDTTYWNKGNMFVTINSTDQYDHKYVDINGLLSPPANEAVSSMLLMRITRMSSYTNDNYTSNKTCGGTAAANLAIIYCDAHYQVNTMGSRYELLK